MTTDDKRVVVPVLWWSYGGFVSSEAGAVVLMCGKNGEVETTVASAPAHAAVACYYSVIEVTVSDKAPQSLFGRF